MRRSPPAVCGRALSRDGTVMKLITIVIVLAAAASLAGTAAAASPSARALQSASWDGGRYTIASGELVTVEVSPAYASDSGAGQRWADFFGSLVHGSELGLLTAYIAPLGEVADICGGSGEVLGCYWNDKLVAVGEVTDGLQPTSVARHEYGHHVAYNRNNAPWSALDWGTKRWASSVNVCARTAAGTAFPGDEGGFYALNPGEAFAESYRVLNEQLAGLPLLWPILDTSFLPSPASLEALRQDVVDPWTGPATRTVRAKFRPHRHVWTTKLATPLDGDLTVRLSQGADDLQLVGDSRKVLATGSWTSTGGKAVQFRICGQRSLTIRVRAGGRPAPFTLKVTKP
jgi:hypothetical protein